MEKAIVKGIVIITVCAMLISVVQASISVENSVSISGTGIIDHYIEAQTDIGMFGQKYTEELRTPALGLFGTSEIESRAEFSMLAANDTDIFSEGAMVSNYTASEFCMRNYDLGVVQDVKYHGDVMSTYTFQADNFSSLMLIESVSTGKTGYNIVVKDTSIFKTLYEESFEILGFTKLNIESYIENISYPCAGGDWLGCP